MAIIVVNKKFYKGPSEYVGRPSILGNPFSHKEKSIAKYKTETVEEAIEKYKIWLKQKIDSGDEAVINELCRLKLLSEKGDLYLGCWCVPFGECHAETIAAVLESFG